MTHKGINTVILLIYQSELFTIKQGLMFYGLSAIISLMNANDDIVTFAWTH